jgi:hypothetical protein
MKIEEIKIGLIKPNPNNPRFIKDDKFKRLVHSVKNFPKMLQLRPIVVNNDLVILGGNMRYQACKAAKFKTIHIVKADDLTKEEQDEFIIKDNSGFGEWDWEILANEWNTSDLIEWGLDIPDFDLPKEDTKEETISIKLSIDPAYSDIEHEVREELESMKGKYNGLNIK